MRFSNCGHFTVEENIDSSRSALGATAFSVPLDPTDIRRRAKLGTLPNRSRGIGFIVFPCMLLAAGFLQPLRAATSTAHVQTPANAPLPAIPQLVREVREKQYQSDAVRENYTYTSQQTTQDIDTNGQVKRTETVEKRNFFVNSHVIERAVKKNGKLLGDYDQKKEDDRVNKLVEKAKKTQPDQPLEALNTNISRIPEIVIRMLAIMEVRNPRRVDWHNRPTIVFDFQGRKDARVHNLAEDTSRNLKGTIWIDEADRQVAHLDLTFTDDFHLAAGLIASIGRGSSFHFDQAPVNGEAWLPTGGEGAVQAHILIIKTFRQRYYERDYDYKRLHVDSPPPKGAGVVSKK